MLPLPPRETEDQKTADLPGVIGTESEVRAEDQQYDRQDARRRADYCLRRRRLRGRGVVETMKSGDKTAGRLRRRLGTRVATKLESGEPARKAVTASEATYT